MNTNRFVKNIFSTSLEINSFVSSFLSYFPRSTCAIFNNIASTHSEGVYVVTFPHTYLHILVPTFTENSNSDKKLHSRIFQNIHWACLPETSLFLISIDSLKLITKLFHKQVFVKSLLVHASGDALNCSVASPILIKI